MIKFQSDQTGKKTGKNSRTLEVGLNKLILLTILTNKRLQITITSYFWLSNKSNAI
jgi:hypothetical protein